MSTATMETKLNTLKINLHFEKLEDLRALCAVMAKTEMVPTRYRGKPDDILVCALHGQEVGLPILAALQSIAVINGIPSIYGDAALALVRSSAKLQDFDEWFEIDGVRQEKPFDIMKAVEAGHKIVAFCFSHRVGMSKPRLTWFSVDQAKQAKLWLKKGNSGQDTPWITSPDRMLMFRARGFNLRDNFGDILKGLIFREEAEDIVDLQPSGPGTYAYPGAAPAEGGNGNGHGQSESATPVFNKSSLADLLKSKQQAAVVAPPGTATEGAAAPDSASAAAPASSEGEHAAPPSETTEHLPATTVSDEAKQAVLAAITKLTSSKKGLALLQGLRKDFKLAPNEEVPLDHRFPYFQVAVQQALAKT
jgi:hypothetical protein